ncbi:ubiquitin carboxyl-terminal hydrolase 10-like [Kogia breviceps]|uniref:ubiquitin carboxyl-terminal hydrolase 10-like n=1 Tax=Kogia breviceps TaxID=27615 RepID=UPI0034D22DC8
MALRNPQYIFGDFSPDEFSQFFVTPRSSVELPPYSGAVLCGAQAAGELPDGQDCQRIEFGVNEVIEPNGALLRTPTYSISSTLNPQAPEFILSCTTSRKIPSDIDKEVNYSSADCQYPGSALALDGSSNVEAEVLENDGVSGGLGQRERKKKEKRPPGYYSYLKDGGEGGPSTEALVNGHAGPAVPNSVGTEDVDSMGDVPPVGTPRTWGSPQDTTDFVSDAVPAGSFPGALDSGARTAGQPEGCPGANLEPSHLPAEASRDTLLRTAVAQPAVGTDTTENLGVTNGQVLESLGEGTAANGVELHTVESSDSDPAKAESGPPPADTPASAAATAPAGQSQPAKSHKPSPSATGDIEINGMVSASKIYQSNGKMVTERANCDVGNKDHSKGTKYQSHDLLYKNSVSLLELCGEAVRKATYEGEALRHKPGHPSVSVKPRPLLTCQLDESTLKKEAKEDEEEGGEEQEEGQGKDKEEEEEEVTSQGHLSWHHL